MSVWRRIGWRRSRGDIGAEVDEELSFHLAARRAELEAQGYSPAEAQAEALRRFGDVADTREVCVAADARREERQRRREHMSELREDAAHALRQLRRAPGFALVAVLTLGLGIGANAAIFAVADHVLLRPLPYVSPERVVTVWENDARTGAKLEVAAGNYLEWRARASSFAAMGLLEQYAFDYRDGGPPEALDASLVSEGWFEAMGVRPLIGRVFDAADYQGQPRVALISEGFWRRRFGADADVIGRHMRIDTTVVEIIGVMPHDQQYPEAAELWVPKQFYPEEMQDRLSRYMKVSARLRDGVTVAQAQAEMDAIARDLAAEYPATNARSGILLVPLEEQITGGVRPTLLLLLGAVGVLLLVACTNLTNLLLARGAERERELAVRAALGAPRGRLVRQLGTESVVLALLGGAVGLGIAWLTVRGLLLISPPELPRLESIRVDARVLLFLLGSTLVTGMLFGTVPALRFSRPQLMTPLRSGRLGLRSNHALRRVLVTAEVALALMLLVGAGLLGRSLLRLADNDTGFTVEQRAFLQTFLWDRNPTREQRILRTEQLLERLRATPGVRAVAAVSALPFNPDQIDARGTLTLEPGVAVSPDQDRRVVTVVVTPDYFDVAGIPVIAGRGFSNDHGPNGPLVAVINQTLARRFFGATNPIGRRVTVGVMGAPAAREIVGVVGDTRANTLDSEPRPELYMPHAQSGTGSMTFVVATQRGAADMLPALRAAVWDVDAEQSIHADGTMQMLVSATLAQRRMHVLLITAFSVFALLLAVMGVYGLISLWARTRLQEIGVRMALGARSRDIVRMIVGHAIALVLPGVIIGLAASFAVSRSVRHLLYDISPTDPWTYAQLAALMLAVATAAAYLPARRAATSDPQRALRE